MCRALLCCGVLQVVPVAGLVAAGVEAEALEGAEVSSIACRGGVTPFLGWGGVGWLSDCLWQ
jgi:hypothetical protein